MIGRGRACRARTHAAAILEASGGIGPECRTAPGYITSSLSLCTLLPCASIQGWVAPNSIESAAWPLAEAFHACRTTRPPNPSAMPMLHPARVPKSGCCSASPHCACLRMGPFDCWKR